jgi:hypothetical protein
MQHFLHRRVAAGYQIDLATNLSSRSGLLVRGRACVADAVGTCDVVQAVEPAATADRSPGIVCWRCCMNDPAVRDERHDDWGASPG